jgi:ribosomal protein L39E
MAKDKAADKKAKAAQQLKSKKDIQKAVKLETKKKVRSSCSFSKSNDRQYQILVHIV